jgi:hypothetical protein
MDSELGKKEIRLTTLRKKKTTVNLGHFVPHMDEFERKTKN